MQKENNKLRKEHKMKEEKPHENHRERLKQRFLSEGLDSFEPHQVLEMLLFYSIPRQDTNETAHLLIDQFETFAGVLDADPKDLATVKGISSHSATFISFMRALTEYYGKQRFGEKPILDSSCKAGSYVVNLFTTKKYETFYIVCLDNQNRVTRAEALFEGTLTETAIYPRNLIEKALRYNANSIIVAHNHPGCSLKPSTADINATKTIKTALETIQIKLVDHIIVGGNEYMSFAEKGLL